MQVVLSPGMEFFADFRQENVCYVDKTGFLEHFLEDQQKSPCKVSIFTPPQRFGKTLMLTTMAEFFDIRKQSTALFEGLAISRNEKLCQEWRNQYPVVFLTLFCAGPDPEAAHIKFQIRNAVSDYYSLLTSPKVRPKTREVLKALSVREADDTQMQQGLRTLCRALYEEYGKRTVLLIDEYDMPVFRARDHAVCKAVVAFLRGFLSASLTANPYLEFAVLTGELCLTQTLFADPGKVQCFGVRDERYADAFGFTEAEVATMLETFGLADTMDKVREWYGGFRFGNRENICYPWEVTRYADDQSRRDGGGDMTPKACLCDPPPGPRIPKTLPPLVSGTARLRLLHSIDMLVRGGSLRLCVREQMEYARVYSSEEDFWTWMYLTGHLTRVSQAQEQRCSPQLRHGEILCALPNREMTAVWQARVQRWLAELLSQHEGSKDLRRLFWKGDSAGVERALSGTLGYILERFFEGTVEGTVEDTVEDTMEDTMEGSHQGSPDDSLADRSSGRSSGRDCELPDVLYFVTLLVLLGRFWSSSNSTRGLGRYDIAVGDSLGKKAALITIQRVDRKDTAGMDDMVRQLEAKAREALQQSAAKSRCAGLCATHTFLYYGMAFCGTYCKVLVQCQDLQMQEGVCGS